MIIHQIMSSEAALLKRLSGMVAASDLIIFVGDGCYQLCRCSLSQNIYASSVDMEMRGLTDRKATLLDDNQWADMVSQASRVVSWL